ncbi:Crp/Fnr family transcriptional regulator [Vampirovibrio sp.]|uniref:Crp/Fnr family transcriptional regulator n=1 Tax=Vampirovibrio sp. TaxID=2717857 RepID=UPI00359402F1
MNTRKYTDGEVIIAEGTYGTQTFQIQEGRVVICKETGGVCRIPISVLTAGEVFGEMYLFDDIGFRTASVVAQGDVLLEVIPKEEMERHLSATPPVVLSMIKTLAVRLAETSQENSLLKYRMSHPLKTLMNFFSGK